MGNVLEVILELVDNLEITPELIEELKRIEKEPIIRVKGDLRKHFEEVKE